MHVGDGDAVRRLLEELLGGDEPDDDAWSIPRTSDAGGTDEDLDELFGHLRDQHG